MDEKLKVEGLEDMVPDDGGGQDTTANFCPFCGTKVLKSYTFCPNCGKALPTL